MPKNYKTAKAAHRPSTHGLLENDTYKEKMSHKAMTNVCAVFNSEMKPFEKAVADLIIQN